MADKKISALTAAATPLAGTEVLPIVQSGATVKVSADNLWAGRVVTSDGFRNQRPGVATQYIEQVAAGGGTFLNIVNNANSANMSYQVVRTTTAGTTTPLELDSNDQLKVLLGNVVMGTAAKGINFTANTPAAGMTSQLLNWYEEGTWTPVLRGATTAGTYEAAAANGRYTRIGRQVTIQCYLELANSITGGGSGYAQLTGLPFAKAADGTFPTAALFTKGVDWAAGTPIVAPITSGSTSTLYFPEIIDNAANNNIDISGFSAQDVISFTLTYNVA